LAVARLARGSLAALLTAIRSQRGAGRRKHGSGRARRTVEATQEERAMPKVWSDKRERQYEHIKESYEERGRSEDKAEELAARTVNKERAEKGETKEQRERSR
jgi:hypothetical protein